MAALADEADMPLEQLLAMYGMVIDGDSGLGPSSAAQGAKEEPSGSTRARSSKRRKLGSGDASPLHAQVDALC